MDEILRKILHTQQDLGEIYTWVHQNPEIACYLYGATLTIDSTVQGEDGEWRPLTAPEVARIVKAMAKGRPIGAVRKEVWRDTMSYILHMGNRIGSICLSIERKSVCVRKVVGTEQVEVWDPNAPKIIQEREVVEWDCIPVLANAENETLDS